MFVIDYDNIHQKLRVGNKILVDYGGVVLTVIGFEPENKYLVRQQRKSKNKEAGIVETSEQNAEHQEDELNKKLKIHTHSLDEDDKEIFQEEIRELINEENQEDEDLANELDRKDLIFPQMTKLDTAVQSFKGVADELEQDQAIFNEVLKKRYQGFNANKFAIKADKARIVNKNSQLGAKMISHFPNEEKKGENTPDNYSPQKSTKSLMNYTMKRSSNEDGLGTLPPEGQSQAFQSRLLPKEYLKRKRLSREEFLRDKHRFF